MAIAALYDIHGNLPALEAVMKELEKYEVDLLVIGGDILPGPFASECLDLLLKSPLKMKFILGNCEEEYIKQMDTTYLSPLPDQVFEQFEWVRQTLVPFQELFISEWPVSLEVDGGKLGKILFCHGTPQDTNEIFTPKTSEERLLEIFSPVKADLIVCGHTHFQFDFEVDKKRIVNAGSVGMPVGKQGAFWLLIDEEPRLMQTIYDYQEAATRVKATAFPNALDFVDKAILNPPSLDSMLQVFEGAKS